MKVTSLGCFQVELGCQLAQIADHIRFFCCGGDLHGLPPCFLEQSDKGAKLGPGQRISSRVGQYSCATRTADQADCGWQVHPWHRDIPRFAIAKILVEGSLHAADGACLHQPLGKMGTTDAVGLSTGQRQSRLVGPWPFGFVQPCCNCPGPLTPSIRLFGKARHKPWMMNIQPQANHMHGKPFP